MRNRNRNPRAIRHNSDPHWIMNRLAKNLPEIIPRIKGISSRTKGTSPLKNIVKTDNVIEF